MSEGTITSPRKLTPAEIEQMRREWEAQYVGYSDAQGRVSYAADEPWLGISSAKVRQRIAGIEGEQVAIARADHSHAPALWAP